VGGRDRKRGREREREASMRAEKIFKLAKGFRGRAKNTIKTARNRVEKALQYMYRDRKNKKRDFRELWIQRINAATREHGVSKEGKPLFSILLFFSIFWFFWQREGRVCRVW
jgi:ribosomal protein L20